MASVLKNIFVIILAACAFLAQAQETIQFGVGKAAESSDVSDGTAELLTSKVSQILNRNSAAAGGDYGIFVVTPTLEVGEINSTSGMVRNVVTIEGTLVLTAKNAYDNAEYYSVSIPLKAVSKGSTDNPALLLAQSIKITDPAYVRFIRKARENISRALEEDCELTVERAQAFIMAGKEQDALAILLALPPGNSCNDLSLELITSIRAQKEKEKNEKEAKEKERREEKIRLAELGVNGSPEDSAVKETAADATDATHDVEEALPEIYSSNPAWTLKVVDCKWIPANRIVSVSMKVETRKSTSDSYYWEVKDAITENGETYGFRDFVLSKSHLTIPSNVPVKCNLDIRMDDNPKKISYIKMRMGNVDFEIKNLIVKADK